MKDNSTVKQWFFIDLRGILWYIYMDVNNYYFNFIYVYI